MKLKSTGELFSVSMLADPDRQSLRVYTIPLDPNKEYLGFYYPGSEVGNSVYVDCPEPMQITFFKGSDLEEAGTNGVRLVHTYQTPRSL